MFGMLLTARRPSRLGLCHFIRGPVWAGIASSIDPFYLTYKGAMNMKFPTRFIELAGEINTKMPQLVVGETRASPQPDSRKRPLMAQTSSSSAWPIKRTSMRHARKPVSGSDGVSAGRGGRSGLSRPICSGRIAPLTRGAWRFAGTRKALI